MRTVLKSHDEVAHVWASQSQSEGRAGNMFFDGPSLFSYGRHFEIARHVKPTRRRPGAPASVVLYRTASYSVSTSKHQSIARSAVSHLKVFNVPTVDRHDENVRAYLKAFETIQAKAVRARSSGDFYRAHLGELIADAAEYAALFVGIEPSTRAALARWVKMKERGELFTESELAKIKTATARERERTKAERLAREKRAADARAEDLAYLEDWVKGAPIKRVGVSDLPTRLRLKDGRIETSRGAQITERKARELWAALVRGVDVAGLALDNYRVNSWDGVALRVGCHEIGRGELERMAALLGLPGALPAAPRDGYYPGEKPMTGAEVLP